jgi:AraC-like DNA-binding protein
MGLFPERLTAGRYRPDVTAYYFKEWRAYEMADHSHPSLEIMYVISGRCRVEIGPGTGPRRAYELRKGEFIFLDAAVPHRLVVPETCRMLNVEFRFVGGAGGFPSLGELAAEDSALAALLACPRDHLVLREPHDVYHALKSLVLELDNPERRDPMIRILFAELLLRVAALYRESAEAGESGAERYVRQAAAFMREHYDRPLRVADIAASVNLHPVYLQRVFKRSTGRSVMAYLTAFRIEKAKMLLRQTDIPAGDIADYVGIGSRQYFHDLFRKHTGMTPAAYRRSFGTHRHSAEQVAIPDNRVASRLQF